MQHEGAVCTIGTVVLGVLLALGNSIMRMLARSGFLCHRLCLVKLFLLCLLVLLL